MSPAVDDAQAASSARLRETSPVRVDGPPDVAPDSVWALYGTSVFAMACALLGDEPAALRAVTMGMVDVFTPDAESLHPSPDSSLRGVAGLVYQRCEELAGEVSVSRTMTGPSLMVWLGELATAQRKALALCVFGGHTYREAAHLLGLAPGTVAALLKAGLHDLARLSTEPVLD